MRNTNIRNGNTKLRPAWPPRRTKMMPVRPRAPRYEVTTLATRYRGATALLMTAASRNAIRIATIGMMRSRSDCEMARMS